MSDVRLREMLSKETDGIKFSIVFFWINEKLYLILKHLQQVYSV